jgi:hypothetical protein
MLLRSAEGGRKIEGMRRLFIAVALALLGCAHEEELRPAREPAPESTFSMAPPPATYATEAPPQGRPRLSKTITLGEDDYSPVAPPPPAGAAGNNGVNVTVNNNINVSPPVIYGGYGYGGYGYSYGGYRGGDAHVGRTSPAWRGSGWEGAQRTAAPGQTPAVGGNWAPPPSYGPQQMK